MTRGQQEQQIFWNMYEEALTQNGNPFSINHVKAGVVTPWATVNSKHAMKDNCIDLYFSVMHKYLQIDLYFYDNVFLFNRLRSCKEDIENIMGIKLDWRETYPGMKPHTRRSVAKQIPIIVGDRNSYANAIEESLPIVANFIKVAQKYAPGVLLDF